MKNYSMIIDNITIKLKAKHNVEAMKYAGAFGIATDKGVKSLIREDGVVVISR